MQLDRTGQGVHYTGFKGGNTQNKDYSVYNHVCFPYIIIVLHFSEDNIILKSYSASMIKNIHSCTANLFEWWDAL